MHFDSKCKMKMYKYLAAYLCGAFYMFSTLPTTLERLYVTVIFNLLASYVENRKMGYKGHV